MCALCLTRTIRKQRYSAIQASKAKWIVEITLGSGRVLYIPAEEELQMALHFGQPHLLDLKIEESGNDFLVAENIDIGWQQTARPISVLHPNDVAKLKIKWASEVVSNVAV